MVLPKSYGPDDVRFADRLLTQIEQHMGFEIGRIKLEVLIESAEACLKAYEIATATPRMAGLIFGIADFAGDIGAKELTKEQFQVYHYPKMQTIVAARAAGIDCIDNVTLQFRDLDQCRKDAEYASKMGFDGKWAIHPDQVKIINEVFTPSKEELTRATDILELYKKADMDQGLGAIVYKDEMVDAATLARRVEEGRRRQEGGPPVMKEGRDKKLPENKTRSGTPIAPLYEPAQPDAKLGKPGEYPFTRGIYPSMYLGKVWTMRQYAGFGTPEETNARFKYLLESGQTGLSVALDLPTQLGFDSDAPDALGEVGKVGVAIDSLADMETIFEGIPLDKVSTSFTINGTATILLAMYQAVAAKQGVATERIAGTIQNDLLKEFGARGAWIFPIAPSMRLVVDAIQYCTEHLPRFNPISIASHFRDAGATPAEEAAYTLSDGVAYVKACLDRGMKVDAFAPRLSFFFYTYVNFFEEVAKYRAARRIWARLMKETFARDERRVVAPAHRLRVRRPFADQGRAAQQHRAHDDRDDGRRLRRAAVGVHRRLRRGVRHSDGAERRARRCACSRSSPTRPTWPRPSIRSPAATSSRRSPTTWSRRSRRSWTTSKPRAAWCAASKRGSCSGASPSAPSSISAISTRAGCRWSASTPSRRKQEEPIQIHRVDEASERAKAEAVKKLRATRDNAATTRALDALETAARGQRQPHAADLRRGHGLRDGRRDHRSAAQGVRRLHAVDGVLMAAAPQCHARFASSSGSRGSTGTTAAPRSWRRRCATPAWRSSTPACARRRR